MMVDLIFWPDKPPQLGEESKRLARAFAVGKLVSRHQREFEEILRYEEEDMLYAALHETEYSSGGR